MIKKIGILLLIAIGANAQDKGKFESYSNPFYGTIISESNKYENEEKEASKSFKMNFDGKQIPKSLAEFTIVEAEKPISQGNTGTCWCFSTTSFYESEILRITGKQLIFRNYTPSILNTLKKQKAI